MFKNLSLNNFKSFSTIQEIPIKPITLVYGANSAGKSSILKSLLLMKQSLDNSDSINSNLTTKGQYVDVGNFKDFINQQNTEKEYAIKFDFDVSNDKEKSRLLRLPNYRFNRIKGVNSLSIEYIYNGQNNKNGILSKINLYLNNNAEPFIKFKKSTKKIDKKFFGRIRIRTFRSISTEEEFDNVFILDDIDWNNSFFQTFWKLADDKKKKEKHLEKINSNIINIKKLIEGKNNKNLNQRDLFGNTIENLTSRLKIYEEFHEFLQDEENGLNKFKTFVNKYYEDNLFIFTNLLFFDEYNEIEEKQDFFNILFHSRAGRSYFYDDDINLNLNINQDITDILYFACKLVQQYLNKIKYIGALRDNPERYYLTNPAARNYVGKSGKNTIDIIANNTIFKNKINKQLQSLNLGYAVVPRKIPNEDIYLFLLKEIDTGITVSLNDVGFGVSQILPILVQSMLSKDETIVIEQPEIHIHPKLQGELGTLFAECIKEPYNNNFIIETHSENIILRLQKLIKKKELCSDDVSVIYVDKTSEGSICYNLRLDDKGRFLDKWPNGFFEESFEEIFG